MFEYDDLGRLARERRYDGADTLIREWSYELDLASNLTQAWKTTDAVGATSDSVTFAIGEGTQNQLESIDRVSTQAGATATLPLSGTWTIHEG